MLKLFYAPGACSLAPHVALEWIGQPYEAVRVSYGDPDYKRINPAGAVPALDTGEGWVLTQAGAVLHYLARRFPEARLGSDGSVREDAEMDRWSSFLTGDLHPAFFPLFLPQRYTVAKDKAAQDDVKAAARELVAGKLDLLETHLGGKPHMIGDRRTVLDAYALPMLRWAHTMVPGSLDTRHGCRALLEQVEADPAVQKVLGDEGLTAAAATKT